MRAATLHSFGLQAGHKAAKVKLTCLTFPKLLGLCMPLHQGLMYPAAPDSRAGSMHALAAP